MPLVSVHVTLQNVSPHWISDTSARCLSRSMRLPATYNSEGCSANFEDGMLRLTFPKSESAKPRRIQISGGSRTNGKPAVASGTAKS